MPIKLEPIPEGYRVYAGAKLLAIISTKHNRGLVRDGAVVLEEMARKDWRIHFTSPDMPIEELAAIAAALPTEAGHYAPTK